MTTDDLKKILISFAAGLGIGVLGGKVYYEKKYQMKLKGETFNSDKKEVETKPEEPKKEETKSEEIEEEKDPKESSELNKNKEDINSMVKKVMDENPRVDYSTPTPGVKKHEAEPEPEITEDFVLEPDDFGEKGDEDYEVVQLLYLADGHLVYENGNTFDPVEQPEKKIGSEALSVLRDDTSEDVIYVRNKLIKIDYEIIRDDRTLNEGTSDEKEDEN